MQVDPLESDRSASATPAAGARSLSWVAVCIVASGVLTYAYQALVARELPTADYGWFGSFWSLALVIGFGTFLPVELELARVLPRRPAGRLPRGSVATLGALTLTCVAVLLALSGLLVPSLGHELGFLFALLAVCVVSSGQFLLRGIMLGSGRLGLHGLVLVVDSGLRVVLALVLGATAADASGGDYAWTLVVAMAVAHLPLLGWLLTRRRRAAGGDHGAPPVAAAESARPFVTAVGHLLVGSLCAQVLLNAAPVLTTAFAGSGQEVVAAQFVASYTLVRLPLFVAVPLQSAMIPVLTGLQDGGDGSRLRAFLARGLAVVTVLAVVAVGVGLWLGPPVVRLVFGDRYALPGGDIAVLAAGSVLHLGLLVGSQALVAAGRHRRVAVVWLCGLAAACLLFVLVDDLVLRSSLAFTVGSGVALVVAAWALLADRPTASGGHSSPAPSAPSPAPKGTPA